MRTYFVYMLASRPGGALYVGVTNNLAPRVHEHRLGVGGLHTRRYGIRRLVYYETFTYVIDAIAREKAIKHWPRAWKTNLIASVNPTWSDLSGDLAL